MVDYTDEISGHVENVKRVCDQLFGNGHLASAEEMNTALSVYESALKINAGAEIRDVLSVLKPFIQEFLIGFAEAAKEDAKTEAAKRSARS